MGARSLASAIKSGEVGTLKLALSHTINLELLTAHLAELKALFSSLEIKLIRGTAGEILELLKKGGAELAIAAEIGEEWDRLDRWPLFSEEFGLILNAKHALASRSTIAVEDLRQERWLRRTYCEHGESAAALMRGHNLPIDQGHELGCEHDLITLIEKDFGIAFAPRSLPRPQSLKQATVAGVELRRTVYLYGVAGRQRTAVASAVLKMLRAADWSRHTN
jgi:DNA-binding transcriptional LysR family regulator